MRASPAGFLLLMRVAEPMTGTYTSYYLIGVLISVPIAKYGVASWNFLAQASEVVPQLPSGADAVSAAALGGVIAWLLGKTIPKLSDDHRQATLEAAKLHADALREIADAHARSADKLNATMEGVRSEVRAGNDSQLALLRSSLHQNKPLGPMGS